MIIIFHAGLTKIYKNTSTRLHVQSFECIEKVVFDIQQIKSDKNELMYY